MLTVVRKVPSSSWRDGDERHNVLSISDSTSGGFAFNAGRLTCANHRGLRPDDCIATINSSTQKNSRNQLPRVALLDSALTGHFLQSATAAPNCSKDDRDILGRWAAKGSDRHARIAKQKITSMQRGRLTFIPRQCHCRPVGRAGRRTTSISIGRLRVRRCTRLLTSRQLVDVERAQNDDVAEEVVEELEVDLVAQVQ